MDFAGAKLILFIGPDLLVMRRDDRPDIPYPGHLDLPGGAREPGETPTDCVLRETREEIGLALAPNDLIWARAFTRRGKRDWFFAAELAPKREADVIFGNEGTGWWLMPPGDFVSHPVAVPHFRDRVALYLQTRPPRS